MLPRAWQTIYLAHDGSPGLAPVTPDGSARQAPSLDRAAHALADIRVAGRDDHERVADLRGLRALRGAQRSVLRTQSVSGPRISDVEQARRLAGRWIELAFHADVAAHVGRSALSLVPRGERRVAVAAVSPARHSWRDRDAEVLPAAA